MSAAPPRCTFCEAVVPLEPSGALPDCCPRCLEPVAPPPPPVAAPVRAAVAVSAPVAAGATVGAPAPEPLLVELVYGRTGAALRLSLVDRLVLGREAGGRELLGNIPQVSRQHCLLERDGDALSVTDLGSTHGTFVGLDHRDCRSGPQRLADSDLLLLGRERFLLRTPRPAPPPPSRERLPDPAPSVEGGAYECCGCFDYRSPVPRFECPRCHTANG